MTLFAPAYYPRFACIASACRHSCCVGWEIDIDPSAHARYQTMEDIRGSIAEDDPPHFRLGEGDRCPHLDEKGLCRIILRHGEDALCEICREHPRFYHVTSRGMEVGLGMSCEEACRIILESDDFDEVLPVGQTDGTPKKAEFDPLPYRDYLYSILKTREFSYPERLSYIADSFGITTTLHSDGVWQGVFAGLEYLNREHKALFAAYSSAPATPDELIPALTRALAYFIFRHLSPADSTDEMLAGLGLAMLCERLLCSMVIHNPNLDIFDAARILSEEIEYSEENTEALKEMFYESISAT